MHVCTCLSTIMRERLTNVFENLKFRKRERINHHVECRAGSHYTSMYVTLYCVCVYGVGGVRCGAATNSSCRGRSGPVITYPVPRTDPTLILLFIAIRVSLSSHTFLLLLLLSLTVCAHSVARMFSCLVTPRCFCCECRDPFNLLFCCSFSICTVSDANEKFDGKKVTKLVLIYKISIIPSSYTLSVYHIIFDRKYY